MRSDRRIEPGPFGCTFHNPVNTIRGESVSSAVVSAEGTPQGPGIHTIVGLRVIDATIDEV
jgi:hypothetical protein